MWRVRARCSRPFRPRCRPMSAIFAAAVADWRADTAAHEKIKKNGGAAPGLRLVENPDILATIAHRNEGRPVLVVGFAAETELVIAHAQAQARQEGLRSDRRQRRVAGVRASWAATPTRSISLPPVRRPDLADPDEGRRWRAASSALLGDIDRGPAAMSLPCPVNACRMRVGLPLPRYETAGAAGLDLVAANAGGRADHDRAPRNASSSRPASSSTTRRLRGAGPAAIGACAQAWCHGAQCARHDRRGLSAARCRFCW